MSKKQVGIICKSDEFWQRLFQPLLLRFVNKSAEKYSEAVLNGEIVPVPCTGISYLQRIEHEIEGRKILIRAKIDVDVY